MKMFWLSQHHRANSGYSNTKIFDINSFDNCFTDLVASSTECTAFKESSMKKFLLTVRQPSCQIRLNCLRLFEVVQNLHKSETTWFRKDSCSILPV